ncbi:hypothetical protein ABZO31_02870 [Streptomyces sp. HUAS MG47]|uniref:hypothetical protein n=1 Tax=Streptomyces solicamelliae TaxID=3231716 RepID=UPI0038783DE6
MTQQPGWGPQQPGQPPYGYPQQPGPYGPPPPQRRGIGVGGGIAIGCGVLLLLGVLLMVIGLLAYDGDSGEAKGPRQPAPTAPAEQPTGKAPATEAPKEQSQADEFKAFVAKNGTEAEKAAIKHVTKVQGADVQNDLLDTADVYTDFEGGIMSKDAAQAKLIASAFADWKTSKNGLVTVYGADGRLISNGNY